MHALALNEMNDVLSSYSHSVVRPGDEDRRTITTSLWKKAGLVIHSPTVQDMFRLISQPSSVLSTGLGWLRDGNCKKGSQMASFIVLCSHIYPLAPKWIIFWQRSHRGHMVDKQWLVSVWVSDNFWLTFVILMSLVEGLGQGYLQEV